MSAFALPVQVSQLAALLVQVLPSCCPVVVGSGPSDYLTTPCSMNKTHFCPQRPSSPLDINDTQQSSMALTLNSMNAQPMRVG